MQQALSEFEPSLPFAPFAPADKDAPDVNARLAALYNQTRHHSDREFLALLDALPAAVYTTDLAGRITFYNQAAAELWGHRPELGKSEWCGSWRLLFPDGRPMRHDECPMAITLREGRPYVGGEAIAVRPDGVQVPFAAYPAPLHDAAGQMVGAVNTLVDISHRKAHEERQLLLINELNHRVKNTLATVQSIALQSLRDCPPEQFERFQGRLVALSEAHDLLTVENWQGTYMHDLINRIVAPLIASEPQRCEVSGPRLFLTPRQSLSLSLALHELCTNAAKYGALSTATGRVLVHWSLSAEGRLRLRWEEKDGPPVQPPERKGFGSRLIVRGVAHELSAAVRLDFPPTGVVCEIDAPLE